ncbi:sialoadhesin-like isoform 2-T2 [Spinachia spinachia]
MDAALSRCDGRPRQIPVLPVRVGVSELRGARSPPPHWRVKRNTSASGDQDCSDGPDRSRCHIADLYPLDSGTYWCESAGGRRGEAVDVFVAAGSVILESPVHPVAEGDHVTLRCRTRDTLSSDVPANFSKDGLLIGSGPTGTMTVHAVSRADEGLYRCSVSGARGSAASRLAVRGEELSYIDVTVTPGARPPAGPKDDSSFYSTLTMGNAPRA